MSGGNTEKPWVFLSYSRGDQPVAIQIIEQLEASGIAVWWDGLLDGGMRYNDITEHRLEHAYAVVVLWSETSVKSHWVHDEAMRGRDRNCLVPASIDGSEPPLGFRQFQCITLAPRPPALDQAAVQTLIHSVRRLHPDNTGEEFPSPLLSAPPEGAGKSFTVNRRWAIGGGAALLAGLGGVAAWQGGLLGTSGQRNSVAVLPFDSIGGDGDQAYFSDGLAAEIRSRLARNPLLKVAAQASSNSFRDSETDAKDIARSLDVAYLLDGNVRREGDRVRVTAELIDGRTGFTTLPLTYDRDLEGIFEIQGGIAAAVIAALSAQMDDQDDGRQVGGTQSVAAYEAFLRARELYDAGTDESSDREALAKFEEAIRIDPEYAAAHAGKSRALALMGNLYAAPQERDSVYGAAADAAREAVRLAPDFADGYSALGFAQAMGLLDMKSAREPYQRSRDLGSGDADILSRYALFRSRIGDFAGADAAIEQAKALDPLNERVFRFKGEIAYAGGRPADALKAFDQAKAIQPGLSSNHYYIGLAQLALGDAAAAKTAFDAESFPVWKHTGGAIAEHRLGNQAAAQGHLAALQAEFGDKSSYQYLQIYAQWGETEKALAAMADALRLRDSGLVQLYNDPLLEPIRSTAEYQELVARLGFV